MEVPWGISARGHRRGDVPAQSHFGSPYGLAYVWWSVSEVRWPSTALNQLTDNHLTTNRVQVSTPSYDFAPSEKTRYRTTGTEQRRVSKCNGKHALGTAAAGIQHCTAVNSVHAFAATFDKRRVKLPMLTIKPPYRPARNMQIPLRPVITLY